MTSHPKKSCYCKWKRIFIRWCYYGSCFKSNDTSDYEKLDISTHIIADCKKTNVALMRLEMHIMQY